MKMSYSRLSKETQAELRDLRRRMGVSICFVSDEVADQPNVRHVVGSIHIFRPNPEDPVVEMSVQEHYDAMCGAMDASASPFPCALRPGHKGEHRYGSEYRFRGQHNLVDPGA